MLAASILLMGGSSVRRCVPNSIDGVDIGWRCLCTAPIFRDTTRTAFQKTLIDADRSPGGWVTTCLGG